MTWWGWVLAATVVVLAAVVAVLVRALVRMRASIGTLERDLAALRGDTVALLADTRSALRRAEGANHRTDALLDTAASVTETVDAATKLAHRVVANPVVKAMSFATGARRTAQRLRSLPEAAQPPSVRPGRRGQALTVGEARSELVAQADDDRQRLGPGSDHGRRRPRR